MIRFDYDARGALVDTARDRERRPLLSRVLARLVVKHVNVAFRDTCEDDARFVRAFLCGVRRIDADEDPSAHDTEITQLGEPLTDEPTPDAALGSSLSVGGGQVAMGMPGFPARGLAGAGAVLVDSVDTDPDRALPVVLTQTTAGVPGTAEKGDRFGASVHLVPDRAGGLPILLVGAPGEDVGRTGDAGTVTIARISPATGELSGRVRTVSQNSAKMAGSVERGDQFGATVSSMRSSGKIQFLVGVPGEDVGKKRDAGMAQTIGTGKGWTQNTAGVPGTAEAGDRMGASRIVRR